MKTKGESRFSWQKLLCYILHNHCALLFNIIEIFHRYWITQYHNVHMHDKLTQEKPNAANVNNLRDARGTKTQNISEMK